MSDCSSKGHTQKKHILCLARVGVDSPVLFVHHVVSTRKCGHAGRWPDCAAERNHQSSRGVLVFPCPVSLSPKRRIHLLLSFVANFAGSRVLFSNKEHNHAHIQIRQARCAQSRFLPSRTHLQFAGQNRCEKLALFQFVVILERLDARLNLQSRQRCHDLRRSKKNGECKKPTQTQFFSPSCRTL